MRAHGKDTLDHVEESCGHAEITRNVINLGLRAVCHDIKIDGSHDYLSGLGFRNSCESAMRLKPKCNMHSGTKCSSFVWIHRHTAGRSKTHILGNIARESVREGNASSLRWAFQSLLGKFIDISNTLEQPMSSVFVHLQWVSRVTELAGSRRIATWLGAFGAAAPKPIKLVSNATWIDELRRQKPTHTMQSLATCSGHSVTGGRNLQESERYPNDFGEAYGGAFKASLDA